jgi:hypothetical protein
MGFPLLKLNLCQFEGAKQFSIEKYIYFNVRCEESKKKKITKYEEGRFVSINFF